MLFRGRISYFTHPPETHTLPTHVSAEIVAEMGKAFDLDDLEKGNREVLAGKLTLFPLTFCNNQKRTAEMLITSHELGIDILCMSDM